MATSDFITVVCDRSGDVRSEQDALRVFTAVLADRLPVDAAEGVRARPVR